MDSTQRVIGSTQNIGPQPVSPLVAMEVTLTAILAAVATEATLAAFKGVAATEATLAALEVAVAKESTLGNVLTALGLLAKDSTVAKDATLGTIVLELATLATEANLTAVKTLVTSLLGVVSQAQGAAAAAATGPMVQALVSDVRPAVTDGTLAPLSLNGEGRLRVTTDLAHVDFVSAPCWAERCPSFFASPW